MDKENFIRLKAHEHIANHHEKVLWSLHAIQKLRVERLRKNDIEQALKESIIIEDYPMEGRPLPGALVLGFVGPEPVHVVVAVDAGLDRVFVITVYRPSEERWEDGWKRRKKASAG